MQGNFNEFLLTADLKNKNIGVSNSLNPDQAYKKKWSGSKLYAKIFSRR